MMYWPSAPMFQTLARKPMARPVAIITRGDAFTAMSGQRCGSSSGSTKISKTAVPPRKPMSVNSTVPVSMVSAIAATGAP